MEKLTAKQVTTIVESRAIPIESHFSWEIKNWQYIKDKIVESTKIEIPEVDAVWWITIFSQNVEGSDINDRNKTAFNFTLKMRSEAWKTNKLEFELICLTHDRNISNNLDNRRKLFQFPFTPIDKEIMTATEFLRSNTIGRSCSQLNTYVMLFKVVVKFLDSSVIRSKTYDPYAAANNILSNVRSLYSDKTFSDFTFVIKDREFKVHKNILGAASSVMHKMFITNMEESRTNRCKLDYIDPDAFEKFLECIYNGRLPDDFGNFARDLYYIADYYGIEWLKEHACMEVSERLCVSNAFETFKWSHHCDLVDLKHNAWQIVKR